MEYNLIKFSLVIMLGIMLVNTISAITYTPTPITLNSGWNYFGAVFNNTDDNLNRTIPLSTGSNLIGVSTYKNISLDNVSFSNGTNYTYSYSQAKANGLVISINTTNGLEATTLYSENAYWIYTTTPLNITLINAGGSQVGDSFPLANIKFSNGSVELNRTDAGTAGWISTVIRYWNPTGGPGGNGAYEIMGFPLKENTFKTYKGYYINSNLNNIQMIFDETQSNPPATTHKCYQESTNVRNQSGTDGDCSLSYKGTYYNSSVSFDGSHNLLLENESYFDDGNWNTFVYKTFQAMTIGFEYSKYILPGGVVQDNNKIRVAWINTSGDYEEDNYTIPIECMQGVDSSLLIRTQLEDNALNGEKLSMICMYNVSGSFHSATLFNNINSDKFIEEGMYWNINGSYIEPKAESQCKNKKCKEGLKIGVHKGKSVTHTQYVPKEHKIIIGKPVSLIDHGDVIVLKGGLKLKSVN